MPASTGLSSLLWFVAIVALIPVVLWLLKRTPLAATQAGGVLRQVAALPLSASQRIVAIEVGQGEARRWLVIGVTPSSITTLHTLEAPPAELGESTPHAAAPFAQLLGRLRKGNDGGS